MFKGSADAPGVNAAFHQVISEIDYVVAAVLFAGAEVVGAVARLRAELAASRTLVVQAAPAADRAARDALEPRPSG